MFDEDFVFDERNGSMGERILEILLYDFDAYSRHVCIGGARIPLTDIDLTQKLKITRPLQVSTNEQVPYKYRKLFRINCQITNLLFVGNKIGIR